VQTFSHCYCVECLLPVLLSLFLCPTRCPWSVCLCLRLREYSVRRVCRRWWWPRCSMGLGLSWCLAPFPCLLCWISVLRCVSGCWSVKFYCLLAGPVVVAGGSLWPLCYGFVLNPFSFCTQPSIQGVLWSKWTMHTGAGESSW
jgi:hypothetical protein